MTMTSEQLSQYIKAQCPRLLSFVSSLPVTDSDDLTTELCDTCNPRRTANRLDDLLSGDTAPVVNEILKDHTILPIFLATISGSRFLFSTLMRRPSIMEALFLHKGYMVRKIRSMMERELRIGSMDSMTSAKLIVLCGFTKKRNFSESDAAISPGWRTFKKLWPNYRIWRLHLSRQQ